MVRNRSGDGHGSDVVRGRRPDRPNGKGNGRFSPTTVTMVDYWKLAVLLLGAVALWVGVEQIYNDRAANMLLLSYGLLGIKFYQLLGSVETHLLSRARA